MEPFAFRLQAQIHNFCYKQRLMTSVACGSYALSCLISDGRMARVWRETEIYFACLANWHGNYGNRDLIFVG